MDFLYLGRTKEHHDERGQPIAGPASCNQIPPCCHTSQVKQNGWFGWYGLGDMMFFSCFSEFNNFFRTDMFFFLQGHLCWVEELA